MNGRFLIDKILLNWRIFKKHILKLNSCWDWKCQICMIWFCFIFLVSAIEELHFENLLNEQIYFDSKIKFLIIKKLVLNVVSKSHYRTFIFSKITIKFGWIKELGIACLAFFLNKLFFWLNSEMKNLSTWWAVSNPFFWVHSHFNERVIQF